MSALRVSPAQWLAVATFLVLAILASTQLRSIWRGEQQHQWPEWFARSLPACVVGGWLMIATLPMELFVMSRPEPVNPWIVLMLLAALLWSAEGRRLAAQELVAWMDSPTTLAAVFDTSGARWSERRQRGEVSRRASDSSPVRSCTAVGTSTSATRSCA